MGEIRPINERMDQAETRWRGITLKRTGNEAYGPCPRCGGTDRFRVFEDGGFWCRQCNDSGWLDDDQDRKLTERELTEIRLRSLEYQRAEHDKRLTLLEVMHASGDHVRYWHNLQARVEAIEYWCNEGMELQTIDDYQLGYCARCPTDMAGRASHTIPVMAFGKLWNIRHRLIGGDQGDKYRPHVAGLPAMLFNADYLTHDGDSLLIVEGEKKSMVAAQTGFPNVGMMGKSGFKPEWARKFARFKTVYVALDPDATDEAATIAALFKGRGRVVSLPEKLDDLVTRYGATQADIEAFMKRARLI